MYLKNYILQKTQKLYIISLMKIKTLIHTAFVAEAKAIIKKLNLTCKQKTPYNIYASDEAALIVSGIGAENTKNALLFAQKFYTPEVFINFGIAGCSDKNIKIGELFCVNLENLDIKFATISSHQNPITNRENIHTLLVDMESEAFLKYTPKNAKKYVFKVVSDYLDNKILSKNEVNSLVQKSLNEWIKYA